MIFSQHKHIGINQTILYENQLTDDNESVHRVLNIELCNTTAASINITLAINVLDYVDQQSIIDANYILHNKQIIPYDTLTLKSLILLPYSFIIVEPTAVGIDSYLYGVEEVI